MRRSVLVASAVLVLAGGVVACSSTTNGSAVPGDDPTGGPTPTTERTSPGRTTTSRPNSGSSPLADLEPCSLLSSEDQARLGVSGGEELKQGSARSCRWRHRGPSESFTLDVLIYDNAGIKDLGSDLTINPLPNVGSHQAVQVPAKAGGACSVVLGVTDSSRVATTAAAGTDQQRGCALALDTARLVEPKLPRG